VTLLSNILTAEDVDAADQLATLMEQSGLTFLEKESAGVTISISRAPAAAASAAAADAAATIDVIGAPHVGIYREVVGAGQGVAAGDVVGRIEVLGDLHDVAAGHAGTVCALCAVDGRFVEYGEPLLKIRRSAAAG